jgi:putative transposase
METPVFRTGRKRRVTSPECQQCPIVCSHVPVPAAPHPPPKKRCCETTAATPGTYGTAVEQHSYWHPGRKGAPGYLEQSRQLTQARAAYPWPAAGSQTVQQQALRDFAQAMAAFFDPGNPAGRPSWRTAGRDQGFRIVGRGRHWEVRRVSRKVGQVWVPKAGWVRFRWSRSVPLGAKSYRVTMDRADRWHIAFAVIPDPIPAPGNGQAVGIDRGVVVSAALSTGELLHAPA